MNRDQFQAAFAEHKNAVYQFAWRLTGSHAVAEDIAQDVFFLLLQGDVEADPVRGSLRALLLGVARRCAWRRSRRLPR